MFHRFRQAKFASGGLILSSSQFLLLPQLPQKMELASKVVKVNSKKLSPYLRSNSVKLTVRFKALEVKEPETEWKKNCSFFTTIFVASCSLRLCVVYFYVLVFFVVLFVVYVYARFVWHLKWFYSADLGLRKRAFYSNESLAETETIQTQNHKLLEDAVLNLENN